MDSKHTPTAGIVAVHAAGTGFDAGQRGWRIHAVVTDPKENFQQIGRRKAACGLIPRWGWGMDLFIEEPCARCAAAIAKAEGRS